MKDREIEVKVELTPEEFQNFAGENAGVFALERTYGYFKDDFSNITEGIFPRIKYIEGEKREIILTVKRKKKDNAQFFEREEVEVKVCEEENGDTPRELMKALGFSKEIIFEKRRKNVFKDDMVISFDELPVGFFAEFEGDPEKIEQYLGEYTLSQRPRITKAYLGVWEDYKKTHGITEEHCVFK
ncbi:MAG: hypothetical protein Q8R40_00105 [bacterium]|nr:hypothetical protein [bacterium]